MTKNKSEKPRRVEDEDNSFIKNTINASMQLRSKNTEFYGLQRELVQAQRRIIEEYKNSKDIKHPRDVGSARENILKNFLTESGLLPRKYGISTTSARVASPSGHHSKELDIVFYDDREAVVLMRRSGAIEYYPRESVFGTIQVKSNLGKTEIQDAFSNVSSYKMLYDNVEKFSGFITGGIRPTTKGFGIVFAYDSDLEWSKLHSLITETAGLYDKSRWPNSICVLSKGIFLFGDGSQCFYHNSDIETLTEMKLHGMPDRDGSCLFSIYSMLMNLLESTAVKSPKVNDYYNLPHTTGELSYSFGLGSFAEVGRCEKHGEYLRKISSINLARVISFCRTETPINWVKAIDIAYGRNENNEAYQKQPGDIFIYNPERLELKDILTSREYTGLTFDAINTEGMQIWIPFYYAIKENIVEGCPKCYKDLAKKAVAHKNYGL